MRARAAAAGLAALLLGLLVALPVGQPATATPATAGAGGPVPGRVPLAAGSEHTCALSRTGDLACWGADTAKTEGPDAAIGPFVAVTAGDFHTCALRPSAEAVCWNDPELFVDADKDGRDDSTDADFGQSDVPAGTSYTALAAGRAHTCGLEVDGHVRCWGGTTLSEDDPPQEVTSAAVTGPNAYSEPVAALAAGGDVTCVITMDRTPRCWGEGTGVAGPNDSGRSVMTIATDGDVTCVLEYSGEAHCWGPAGDVRVDGPELAGGRYLDISVGSQTCALGVAGKLRCWGDDASGAVSGPNGSDDLYVALASRGGHVCAVSSSDVLRCWGDDADGQASVPADLAGTLVPSVSAGAYHTCAVEPGGSLSCFGRDIDGQTSGPDTAAGSYRQVSAGRVHTCAVTADGRAVCWGDPVLAAVPQELSAAGAVRSLSAGPNHTCAVLAGGTVTCWGAPQQDTPDPSSMGWLSVDAGVHHTCVINLSGRVYCWGEEVNGEVTGPYATASSFDGPRYRTFSAGWDKTCATDLEGKLTCWGDGADPAVAGPNESLDAYGGVTVGAHHTCGLGTNGRIDCWGVDDSGEVDLPTADQGSYLSVDAGWYHTCAVGTDGLVHCWGRNDEGQSGSAPEAGAVTVPPAVGLTPYEMTTPLVVAGNPAGTSGFACPGGAPPGIDLHPGGTISGRPTVAGEYPCSYSVSNVLGSVVQDFTLTVDKRVPTLEAAVTERGRKLRVSSVLKPGQPGMKLTVSLQQRRSGGWLERRVWVRKGVLHDPDGDGIGRVTAKVATKPLGRGTYRFVVRSGPAPALARTSATVNYRPVPVVCGRALARC